MKIKKEAIDQIIQCMFLDDGSTEKENQPMDLIPETFQDWFECNGELPMFNLEEVNTVFYILHKAGIFEPQDIKGNWWTTPLYWVVFDQYHSLENRIEKDKDGGEKK